MPSVAIIPVAILMLGIGDSMIVAVTVYASVWPILINTIDGVRHIESTLIDTGRTFGLSRWRILWQIILPGASPYIVTGLAHRFVHRADLSDHGGDDRRQQRSGFLYSRRRTRR